MLSKQIVNVCQGSVIVSEFYLCIQHIQLSATKAYLGTRRRAKGAVEAKRARQHWRLQMILQHGYFCWKHRTIWLQYGKTMEDTEF